MKTTKALILIVGIVAVWSIFPAAVSFAEQPAGKEDKTTSQDLKKETSEALQALKNYSVDKKNKAVKEAKVIMDDLDARIDRIQKDVSKRWDKMDQAAREKTEDTLNALQKQRNHLSEWYGGVKHSSADAWDQVKDGFIKSYENLANSFEKAKQEFSQDEPEKSGR